MSDKISTNNPHLRAVHLTDEQFADLLMGATTAAVQQHLSSCTECAAEAERVGGAIGSFERESRLWAERRAASQPVLTAAQKPSSPWANALVRPRAWAAAALAVAVGVGIAVSTHHPQQPQQAAMQQPAAPIVAQVNTPTSQQAATIEQPSSPASASAARVTPSKLKADNQLLSAIDGELRADSTPANFFGLDVSSHAVRSRTSGRVTN